MAFLTKYRELRGEMAQGLDEVEYNFGRAFQQLGGSAFHLFTMVPMEPSNVPFRSALSRSSTLRACLGRR